VILDKNALTGNAVAAAVAAQLDVAAAVTVDAVNDVGVGVGVGDSESGDNNDAIGSVDIDIAVNAAAKKRASVHARLAAAVRLSGGVQRAATLIEHAALHEGGAHLVTNDSDWSVVEQHNIDVVVAAAVLLWFIFVALRRCCCCSCRRRSAAAPVVPVAKKLH
jgi:hypothetical protein